MKMLSIDIDGIRFTHRAAGVAVSGDRLLLNRGLGEPYWFLPGGRINAGEDSASALLREMREEIGQDVVLGDLFCTIENFFEHKGRRFHELGVYYAMEVPKEWEGSVFLKDDGEDLEYRWMPLAELAATLLYPEPIKDLILGKLAGGHLIIDRRDGGQGPRAWAR
ncbi:MAG TPA: NUDIX domain-containing protein [Rectinemataceae bacterium]|nr:NUDIX domain-containing protein [Rectinemataceae bacterium]